ncbi:hypothetical protein [Tellurirhabdus bombi]|uniref:hypothetical protein n=1 Tax=Tellurirhabdus bombi TaxID=2907205 RepID=UPI001F3A20E1|nr:hypothetical protein [Tellurirhabdus bombi]
MKIVKPFFYSFSAVRGASRFTILGLFFVLTNCSAPDRLGKLDLVKWRQDRGGCQGVRTGQIDDLKSVREELKGKMANDINKILGRPDINQLADRNQKYYVYFLERGAHCQDVQQKSTARTVALRIGAIGVVTEVTFQRGQP